MSISFSCECCKKRVKAPDNAGGKWGACPQCGHRCYIPLPHSDDEPELKLIPLDDEGESQYGQMMQETQTLAKKILHETQMPDDAGEHIPGAIGERELLRGVIIYLRQMADGELSDAEVSEEKLLQSRGQVKMILKKMAKAQRPEPELSEIAPKLLKGLMKSFYAKL